MKLSIYLSAFLLTCSPLAFVHPVRLKGNSMEPTLKDGQVLLVLWPWCSGRPKLGEVWVFDGPEGSVIKRILALPGQKLEQINGYLLRDGMFVEEPYVSFRDVRDGGPWGSGDGYLLLGDNRPASRDCRLWGAAGRDQMRGRALGGG
jgi:signal peptidase I